jgi:hypothetical protein
MKVRLPLILVPNELGPQILISSFPYDLGSQIFISLWSQDSIPCILRYVLPAHDRRQQLEHLSAKIEFLVHEVRHLEGMAELLVVAQCTQLAPA